MDVKNLLESFKYTHVLGNQKQYASASETIKQTSNRIYKWHDMCMKCLAGVPGLAPDT